MNSPCSKLQGITSAPLCFADKADYNFALNPSHAASSGEFKLKNFNLHLNTPERKSSVHILNSESLQ